MVVVIIIIIIIIITSSLLIFHVPSLVLTVLCEISFLILTKRHEVFLLSLFMKWRNWDQESLDYLPSLQLVTDSVRFQSLIVWYQRLWRWTLAYITFPNVLIKSKTSNCINASSCLPPVTSQTHFLAFPCITLNNLAILIWLFRAWSAHFALGFHTHQALFLEHCSYSSIPRYVIICEVMDSNTFILLFFSSFVHFCWVPRSLLAVMVLITFYFICQFTCLSLPPDCRYSEGKYNVCLLHHWTTSVPAHKRHLRLWKKNCIRWC